MNRSAKTDTFRFRIQPDVKEQIEAIYAKCGLTLTQAINIFIQQSINAGGLPFQATESNAEYIKTASLKRLMKELEAGKASGDPIDEDEVYRIFGVEH